MGLWRVTSLGSLGWSRLQGDRDRAPPEASRPLRPQPFRWVRPLNLLLGAGYPRSLSSLRGFKRSSRNPAPPLHADLGPPFSDVLDGLRPEGEDLGL